jgi:hypothetical protein
MSEHFCLECIYLTETENPMLDRCVPHMHLGGPEPWWLAHEPEKKHRLISSSDARMGDVCPRFRFKEKD